MNAVLLISGLMFGGGQKVVLDLLRELRGRKALIVRLVVLGCRDTVLQAAASHVVPYSGRYNRPATLLLTAWRLRAHLKADRPDVLHTHGWDADLIGWLATLRMETRQIIHCHVTPSWLESRRLTHQIRRFLTRRILARPGTRPVAVSNAVRAYWVEHLPWNPDDFAVVPNAVDLAEFPSAVTGNGQHDTRLTLGTAARLEPMKGIEYLLDAMAKLTTEHPDIRLRVAGEGKLKGAFQSRSDELGLGRNVEFLGHLQDLRPYYNSLDIFVLPSLTEGLPLAILEASAAALPVVATAVGGTPEVIRNGQDGLLVPPGDSSALADAILRLLADPSLRSRLGRSARERVESHFSIARCANAVLDLYHGQAVESIH